MLSMGTLRAAQPAGCLALLALLRPDTPTAIAASVFAMMHTLLMLLNMSVLQRQQAADAAGDARAADRRQRALARQQREAHRPHPRLRRQRHQHRQQRRAAADVPAPNSLYAEGLAIPPILV